jgi:hypothetical protein
MQEKIRTKRKETLEYVQAMLGQLRRMVQAERCDFLACLVEMAYVETSDILRGARPARASQPVAEAVAAGEQPCLSRKVG